MNILKADNLACPLDGLKLESKNRQWCCPNGHSFDTAKQGYINLLPVQQKRSRHPGDSKAMVSARAQFLNAGFYEPIAQRLSDVITALIKGKESLCILDAGCGEGYYLDHITHSMNALESNIDLSFIGLDISKQAILKASKRNREITWVVGTNRQPPVCDNSVDIILCIFGFVNLEGFSRILKPEGRVILLDPGPEHLKELRAIIYDEVRYCEPEHSDSVKSEIFSLVDNQHYRFKTGALNNENITDLLMMTPHLFRANKSGKEAAARLQALELTVDMNIRTLTKR